MAEKVSKWTARYEFIGPYALACMIGGPSLEGFMYANVLYHSVFVPFVGLCLSIDCAQQRFTGRSFSGIR